MSTIVLIIGPAITLLFSIILSVYLTKWFSRHVLRYIIAFLLAIGINLVGQFIYFLPILSSLYPPGEFGGIGYLFFLGASLIITVPLAILVSFVLISRDIKKRTDYQDFPVKSQHF